MHGAYPDHGEAAAGGRRSAGGAHVRATGEGGGCRGEQQGEDNQVPTARVSAEGQELCQAEGYCARCQREGAQSRRGQCFVAFNSVNTISTEPVYYFQAKDRTSIIITRNSKLLL